MIKMNERIRQMWKDALSSGVYKKGMGALIVKDDDDMWTYCCLGVLCDLHRIETGKGEWKESNSGTMEYITDNGSYSDLVLPKEVQEWAGLSCTNPAVSEKGNKAIAAINDQVDTFEEVNVHI